MRVFLAAAAAAALALGLLGPASARRDATAKYGGTLVVGLGTGDFDSLDPTVSRSPQLNSGGLCLRLYETADNHGTLALTPVLAAATPAISPDKLSYTVKLRQGIEFNDGTPFNAQAVITSYQRYITYPGSTKKDLFAAVDTVTTTGPYTVVFHLNARDSSFTPNMPVLSPTAIATEGANFAANPVCVGPFMFDRWIPGDNLTLIKSPYYYKRSAVHLDKIVYRPMSDAAAAVAALQAGDIQVLTAVPTTALPAVQQNPGLMIIETPPLGWRGVVINIGNKNGVLNLPYSNVGTPLAQSPKLRQAFEEAIDRDALNRVVFAGLNEPNCTAIPHGNTAWYDATKIPCTRYDPSHAKNLVAASGFTNPTVHLLTSPSTVAAAAPFIQAEEAAVGINVVIDSTDNPTATARLLAGNFDAALRSFPGDFDPYGQIERFLATSGDNNYGGYSNPRMDYVLANALKATGLTARATDYHVAQQIAQTDRPIIYLYDAPIRTVVSVKVTGVSVNATGVVFLANAQFK